MHIDLGFYEGYFKWTRTKAKQLVTAKPEQVPQFVAETAAITKGLLEVFAGVVSIFSGGFVGIALNVGKWLKANADPLKPTREAIKAMYLKWGT